MRRTKFALLGLSAAVIAGISWVAPAQAQTDFRGQEIYDLARRSIDITESQLRLHQAQHRYGELYWYAALTERWAPGRFVMDDGSRLTGNLSRSQLAAGGGFGTTQLGFMLGMQADVLGTVGLPTRDKADEAAGKFKPGGLGQMLYFLGGSFYDVQASAGLLMNEMGPNKLSLDNYGTFSATGGSSFRPGTPEELQSSTYASSNPPNSLLFTLFEGRSGAYLAMAYGDRLERRVTQSWTGIRYYSMESVGSGIQDLRLHVQPLERYLPAWIGLLFADIKRYQTAASDFSRSLQGVLPTASDAPPARTSTDFSLGADDVLEGGVRWRVAVNDEAKFRAAELGYVDEFRKGIFELVAGARAIAVNRPDGVEPAADAFVKASLVRKKPAMEGRAAAAYAGLALSYSYNSPDSTTFLAIPRAHVIGIQVSVGPTEMARPLIPLVRAVESRRKKGED